MLFGLGFGGLFGSWILCLYSGLIAWGVFLGWLMGEVVSWGLGFGVWCACGVCVCLLVQVWVSEFSVFVFASGA